MNEDQKHIALTCKQLRNELNLYQDQLSNLLNVSRCTISDYENNKRNIPLTYILSLLYLSNGNLIKRIENEDLKQLYQSIDNMKTCAACGHKYRYRNKKLIDNR